jgi:hypothetical protein
MSKHTARHHKKAAIGTRAARPSKRAHGGKSPRAKKAAKGQNQVSRRTVAKQLGAEPDLVTFQFANLDNLEQGQVSGEAIVEIFEVEVADDAEGAGLDDKSELTPDSSD